MKQIIHKIFHRMKEDSLVKKAAEVKRGKEYPVLESVKSCVVVWCAHEKEKVYLKEIARRLPGVKVEKICFLPEGMEALQPGQVTYVKDEELGFGGKIMNAPLEEMLAKKYDLLIDLSEGENVMVEYILKHSQAKCKAGRVKENFEADIMVDGVEDMSGFIEQLFVIMSKLKKY